MVHQQARNKFVFFAVRSNDDSDDDGDDDDDNDDDDDAEMDIRKMTLAANN